VPKNKEEHGKNSARESTDEHRILNARPVSPEFLAASIREPAIKFYPSSAIPATTVSVAAIAAVFSSVTSDPGNPATATHSGNTATTSGKFVKVSVKFGTPELQSLAIVRNHHANYGRVSHGIRDQEAKKQLLQVCEHYHQRRPNCTARVGKSANHLYRKRFQAEIRDSQ
jgi:hypothetical protein